MIKRFASSLALAAAILSITACSKSEPKPETTSAQAAAQPATAENNAGSGGGGSVGPAQAKEIFNTRCATCHGPEGKGNGPGAVTLNPKPRNYHDKAWQASVTDEQIKKTILYGGAAVGKSPIMPASPDLDGKPEVLDALVKMVRAFGKE